MFGNLADRASGDAEGLGQLRHVRIIQILDPIDAVNFQEGVLVHEFEFLLFQKLDQMMPFGHRQQNRRTQAKLCLCSYRMRRILFRK